MTEETATPGFWATVWARLRAILSWMATKLLAPGVAVIVVIVAVVLVAMGFKELQVGGLLARLLGRKSDVKADPQVVNTPPPNRVDAEGRLIQPGTPDSKGDTQAVVIPIEQTGGMFSNPTTVRVTPPGTDKPIDVELPDGVRAKDVDKVIIVTPEKVVVTVRDNSGIPAGKIDDLLSKYN